MSRRSSYIYLTLIVILAAVALQLFAGGGPSSTPATFSGSSYAVGAVPGSLIVGDYNLDGAPDAVVTTPTGVVTFQGQFASGLPNGTLGAASSIPENFACGAPINVVSGIHQFRAPLLYGLVTAVPGYVFSVDYNAAGWFTTTATCNNTGGYSGQANRIAAGDFDCDGYTDLALVNNTNSIYIGQGTSFGINVSYFGTLVVGLPNGLTGANTVATGDFNGDGHIDVIAGAGTNVVFFPSQKVAQNTSLAGAFTTATASSTLIGGSSNIVRVLVAEATGDGKADIVATTANSVVVIPGNGAGAFGTPVTLALPTGYTANATAVGDFNGDGFPDIAVAATGAAGHSNAVLQIFYGTGPVSGSPTYAPAQAVTIGSNASAILNPVDIAAFDMNHDGRMDLVVSTSGDSNVWVLLNTSRQLIVTSATGLPFNAVTGGANPTPASATIATSDNGALPALSVNTPTGATSLSWVTPTISGGQLTITPNIAGVPVGTYSSVLSISGAGYMNVTIPYTVTIVKQAGMFIQGGTSNTLATGIPGTGGAGGPLTTGMSVGDFDGDGIPDVFASLPQSLCGGGGCAGVWTRSAKGTTYTQASSGQALSTNPSGLTASATADFNRDGKIDVVMVGGGSGATVAFGDGAGGFTGSTFYRLTGQPTAVAVADLNGDGYPDIVVSSAVNSFNGGGLNVMLNDGLGGFSTYSLQSTKTYQSVAVGDFNGDGIPDLVAHRNNTNVTPNDWGLDVFLGQPGGRFGAPQQVAFPTAGCVGTVAQCTRPTLHTISGQAAPGYGIAVGDFNGDGITDLAFIDSTDVLPSGQPLTPAIVVALSTVDSQHNVTFQLAPQGVMVTPEFNAPTGIAAGDVDGDGKLDLVYQKYGNGGSVAVRLGVGDGTFPNEEQFFTQSVGNQPMILADLDGDGRLDMIGPNIANSFTSPVGIYMGVQAPTSLAFNGVPVSAAALAGSQNITFQGVLSLSPPFAQFPLPWVRTTAVPVNFADSGSPVGGGVPVYNAASNPRSFTGTFNGPVTVGSHSFTASFAGDGRLAPANSPAYVPNLQFSQQPLSSTLGTAMFTFVVRVLQPGSSTTTDSTFTGPVSISLDHGTFTTGSGSVTVNAGSSGFSNGFAPFAGLIVSTPGIYHVTAMAGSTLLDSNTFSVSGGPGNKIAVTGLSANVTAGASQSVQVQVQDSSGFPAGNYTGTVQFLSSDPLAVLPSNYTFSLADVSTKSFNVTFKTPGAQTLTVKDTVTSALTKTVNTTVGAGPAAAVVLNSPASTAINTNFPILTATVTDSFSNAVSGATVQFGNVVGGTGSNGTFVGGSTAVTNASGVASIMVLANNKAGTFTVTGATGGVSSTSRTLTITNGPASTFSVTGFPNPTLAGAPGNFTVTALDAGGNTATNYAGTVAFTSSDPLKVLPANYTFVPGTDNGSHVFSGTLKTVGTQSITATDTVTGSITGTQAGLTVQAGAAVNLRAGGTPQSATVGTAFATALSVTVTDSGGNGIANQSIVFTAPASGVTGTFTGGSNTVTINTNASGVATAPPFTANTKAGLYGVTATLGAISASFSLTNTAGPATQLGVQPSSTNQQTPISTAFPNGLVVTVLDAFGNAVSGVNVTFTAPSSGPSAGLAASGLGPVSLLPERAGTQRAAQKPVPSGFRAVSGGSTTVSVTTDGLGIASVNATANGIAGSYNISVTEGALSANISLTNTAGAPGIITAVSGTPQSTVISTAFGAAMAVKVTDSGSNPLSGVSVTFTPPGSGASGAFTGSPVVTTDATGTATAPTFTANTVAGGYIVKATVGALTQNLSLTNLPGAPAIITPAGTPQTAALSQAFATPLSVKITDASSNVISGVSVTFTAPSSGATGTFAGSGATAAVNTNSSGIATAPTFTANSTIGAYTLKAQAGALSANFSLSNILNPAAGIQVVSGSGQSAELNSSFPLPLTAKVFDALGNGVANATVVFTIQAGAGNANFSGGGQTFTTTTNAQGLATTPGLNSGGSAGSYTVTATTGAFQTVFSLTNAFPLANPPSLTFLYEIGGAIPPAQTTAVSFSTAGAATDQPWLKVLSAGNTAVVTVVPTGLAANYYTGNVIMSQGLKVPVTFIVTQRPLIRVTPGSLSFQYTQGQPAPATQDFTISALVRNFGFSITAQLSTPAAGVWLQFKADGSTTPSAVHVSAVPGTLAPGIYQGSLHIVAPDASNSPVDVPVTFTITAAGPPTPVINGMSNAASSQSGPVSANEIVSLYGTNFTCSGTTQVLVDGAPATILSATATQINFVVPDLSGKTQASIQVSCGTAISAPSTQTVAEAFPGIFTGAGGQVAAFDTGFALNAAASPASAGSIVMLFGTGFGPLNPPDGNGLQSLVDQAFVFIGGPPNAGGVPADVTFAGAAPGLPGVTQINIRIPAGTPPGAAVSIYVMSRALPTQPGLTVAVQ